MENLQPNEPSKTTKHQSFAGQFFSRSLCMIAGAGAVYGISLFSASDKSKTLAPNFQPESAERAHSVGEPETGAQVDLSSFEYKLEQLKATQNVTSREQALYELITECVGSCHYESDTAKKVLLENRLIQLVKVAEDFGMEIKPEKLDLEALRYQLACSLLSGATAAGEPALQNMSYNFLSFRSKNSDGELQSSVGPLRLYSDEILLDLISNGVNQEAKQLALDSLLDRYIPASLCQEGKFPVLQERSVSSLLRDAERASYQNSLVLTSNKDQELSEKDFSRCLILLDVARKEKDRAMLLRLSETLAPNQISEGQSFWKSAPVPKEFFSNYLQYLLRRIEDKIDRKDQQSCVDILVETYAELTFQRTNLPDSPIEQYDILTDRLFQSIACHRLSLVPNHPHILQAFYRAAMRNGDDLALRKLRPYVCGYDTTFREGDLLNRFGDRIEYLDYPDIPFEFIPSEPIALPTDFFVHGGLYQRSPYPEAIKTLITKELANASKGTVEKLEDLKNWKAKSALNLAILTTSNLITYYDIDNDPSFEGQREVVDVFEHGYGDCDKYSRGFIEIVEVFKEYCPQLTNVHVGHRLDLEEKHIVNEIYIFTRDTLLVSDIDVSAFDAVSRKEDKRFYTLSSGKKYFENQSVSEHVRLQRTPRWTIEKYSAYLGK